MTLGFGPFSLFRHKVFPESLATTLHHRLHRLADRGVSRFRSTGAQYLVMARKSAPRALLDSRDTEESTSNTADLL
jgi:hypothetical protein